MLAFESLLAARDALAARQVSAEQLTRAALECIKALDPKIHAFNSVWDEHALEQARRVDAGERSGALAGMPIALKDNLCTRFGLTTCSSRMLSNFRSPYDAAVVEKLSSAGAVII